jgi:hypothetical protein
MKFTLLKYFTVTQKFLVMLYRNSKILNHTLP